MVWMCIFIGHFERGPQPGVDHNFNIAAQVSVFFLCGAWIRFTPVEKKEISGKNSVIIVYLYECNFFIIAVYF